MKFTGEFFIPQPAEEKNVGSLELEIEHKQRYSSILKLVEGKTVLDIASGEGYGTCMLASRAAQMFGVDINPDLVEHASRKYNRENIRFLHGSVNSIPLESNSIDIIVSFETLEHVNAETQQQFIREVKRVLKPGGVFIVSTPNKKNYTDRYDNQNQFHIHELYPDDFEQFLKGHFKHIRLYDQGQEVTSIILNREDYLSQTTAAIMPINNVYHFEGKYLIGLCSDLPDNIQASIASIVPESEKSYFQLIDRILQLQREVEELGTWGTRSARELETMSGEKQAIAQELETLSREMTVTIQRLEQEKATYIDFYANATRKIQEDLARSNHAAFLLQAELETIQNHSSLTAPHSFDMTRFTEELTRLSQAASGKDVYKSILPSAPPKNNQPVEAPLTEIQKQEMIKLQQDIIWYRKTYEERSLLGIIKEKIAAKFRK